jgi:hypothetical protein
VRGFAEIIEGKHDDLPEAAFYMVGSIEEAVERAKELAGQMETTAEPEKTPDAEEPADSEATADEQETAGAPAA